MRIMGNICGLIADNLLRKTSVTQFTIFGTTKKERLFLGVRKKMEEIKYSFHCFLLETTYSETNNDRNLLQIRCVSILSYKNLEVSWKWDIWNFMAMCDKYWKFVSLYLKKFLVLLPEWQNEEMFWFFFSDRVICSLRWPHTL